MMTGGNANVAHQTANIKAAKTEEAEEEAQIVEELMDELATMQTEKETIISEYRADYQLLSKFINIHGTDLERKEFLEKSKRLIPYWDQLNDPLIKEISVDTHQKCNECLALKNETDFQKKEIEKIKKEKTVKIKEKEKEIKKIQKELKDKTELFDDLVEQLQPMREQLSKLEEISYENTCLLTREASLNSQLTEALDRVAQLEGSEDQAKSKLEMELKGAHFDLKEMEGICCLQIEKLKNEFDSLKIQLNSENEILKRELQKELNEKQKMFYLIENEKEKYEENVNLNVEKLENLTILLNEKLIIIESFLNNQLNVKSEKEIRFIQTKNEEIEKLKIIISNSQRITEAKDSCDFGEIEEIQRKYQSVILINKKLKIELEEMKLKCDVMKRKIKSEIIPLNETATNSNDVINTNVNLSNKSEGTEAEKNVKNVMEEPCKQQ